MVEGILMQSFKKMVKLEVKEQVYSKGTFLKYLTKYISLYAIIAINL